MTLLCVLESAFAMRGRIRCLYTRLATSGSLRAFWLSPFDVTNVRC